MWWYCFKGRGAIWRELNLLWYGRKSKDMTQIDQSTFIEEALVPREIKRFLLVAQWVKGRTGTRNWVLFVLNCIFPLNIWVAYLYYTESTQIHLLGQVFRGEQEAWEKFVVVYMFQSSSASALKKETCLELKTGGSFSMEQVRDLCRARVNSRDHFQLFFF